MLQLKVASIGGKPRAKTVQVESDSDSSDDEDSEAEDDNKPSGKQVVKMVRSLDLATIGLLIAT